MGVDGLEYQNIDIRFDKGLDTRTQKKLVMPGKWDSLVNLTLTKDFTLRRRDGMQQYARPNTSTINDGVTTGLATFNKELLLLNGPKITTVVTTQRDSTNNLSATPQVVSGQPGWMDVNKDEIYRSSNFQRNFDCAQLGSWTIYIWNEFTSTGATPGTMVQIVDETTGARVFSATYAIFSARVVAATSPSSAFYVVGYNAGTTQINCVVINLSTTAAPSAGTLTTLLASANLTSIGQPLDAIAGNSVTAPGMLVAFVWSDGVTSMRCMQVTHSGSAPSVTTTLNLQTEALQPNAGINSIAIANGIGGAAVFSWGTQGIRATGITFTSPWTVGIANTTIDGTASYLVGCRACALYVAMLSQYWVFTDYAGQAGTVAGVTPLRRTVVNANLTTGVVTTTLQNSNNYLPGAGVAAGPQGPYLLGKPFLSGANQSAPVVPVLIFENYSGLTASSTDNTTNTNLQNSVYFMDGSTGVIIAKALYGTTGPFALPAAAKPANFAPGSALSLTSTSLSWMAPERIGLTVANGINQSPSNICRITLTPQSLAGAVSDQLGQSTYFAGGSLTTYDGLNLVEHGFYLFPEGVNAVVSAGAAGVTAGAHQFIAVYEWIDNAGQRHQSAPSIPQNPSLTFTAGNLVATLKIPTLQLTQKTNVRLVVYMTQANGTVFYRVNKYNGAASITGVANDKTQAFITVTIDSSDAEIGVNELLYNQPLQANTTLPNNSPPPCNTLAIHQGRIFINVADNPYEFRYSQQLTFTPSGPVGLQFNESLGGNVESTSGGLVAFGTLDEKVIIFCGAKNYVVYGTGPNAAGGYNNYSDPQLIPGDVGCVEPRSILKTPVGLVFKTGKGWYLLGRDLSVRDIGDAVAEYDGDPVSAAVMLEDRQEARFTSRSGRTLVYSYNIDQWSVFEYASTPGGITGAVWWRTIGAYVHAHQTLGIFKETPGVKLDQNFTTQLNGIRTYARLGFLHVQALGGYQRVKWLYFTASSLDSPTSTLTIGVDFNDSYSNPDELSYVVNVNFGLLNKLDNYDSIDLRHKLRRQKCKSVAFTFTEDGGSGDVFLEGMQAITLRVGVKRGTNKLPAAQSVG